MAILECPFGPISVENCKKCPHCAGYDVWRKEAECKNLTGSEIKMQPEPVKDQEYKSKW